MIFISKSLKHWSLAKKLQIRDIIGAMKTFVSSSVQLEIKASGPRTQIKFFFKMPLLLFHYSNLTKPNLTLIIRIVSIFN